MADRRIATELTIPELEEVIAIRRREMRHTPRSEPRKHRTHSWRERILLLLEIGVLFGLIWAVIDAEQSRAATNQAMAVRQPMSTARPSPADISCSSLTRRSIPS